MIKNLIIEFTKLMVYQVTQNPRKAYPKAYSASSNDLMSG